LGICVDSFSEGYVLMASMGLCLELLTMNE